MALSYTKLATTVATLMARYGRSVNLVKFDDTPDDSAKPWGENTDQRTAATVTGAYAVSVPPETIEELGLKFKDESLAKRASAIFLIEPGSVDLATYDEIRDGTTEYKIEEIDKLQPGATVLLWYVGGME